MLATSTAPEQAEQSILVTEDKLGKLGDQAAKILALYKSKYNDTPSLLIYLEASTEQIEAISKFKDTVQQLEDSVGNLRTRILAGFTVNLIKQRDELSNTLDKLQQTADIINNIGQLTDMATEVAEIAAGFMKL